MASMNEEVKVTVSVEEAIHKGVAEVVQNIFDEYGIQVKTVSVQWLDVSQMSGEQLKVQVVEMTTASHRI